MTSTPKIKLSGVTRSFGDNHALRGIDLEVATGESVVLIGGSGAGKTLILKCILGLVRPDGGEIYIDGQETARLGEKERMRTMDRFGMLFQRSALFDSMSVWENVAFRLLQDGAMTRARAREIALDKLSSVGLDADVAALLPAELSGGMQKRVGIARAIATDPEIVFLDEPTAGLDPIMSNIVNDMIIAGVRKLGATVISVTSDMVGARRISDRISMIHEGRAIWTGPTAELDTSGNPYVDQFINQRAEGPIETALAAS